MEHSCQSTNKHPPRLKSKGTPGRTDKGAVPSMASVVHVESVLRNLRGLGASLPAPELGSLKSRLAGFFASNTCGLSTFVMILLFVGDVNIPSFSLSWYSYHNPPKNLSLSDMIYDIPYNMHLSAQRPTGSSSMLANARTPRLSSLSVWQPSHWRAKWSRGTSHRCSCDPAELTEDVIPLRLTAQYQQLVVTFVSIHP